MKSIRVQAMVLSSVYMVVIVTLGMCALAWLLQRSLTDEFDQTLRARAEGLASLVQWDGANVEFDFAQERTPWVPPSGSAGGFAIWCDDGTGWKLLEHLGLTGLVLDNAVRESEWLPSNLRDASSPLRGLLVKSQVAPDNKEGEAHEMKVPVEIASTSRALQLKVFVALPRKALDQQISNMQILVSVFGVALVAAAAIASGLAVWRGLRPLAQLSTSVASLGPHSPGARLDTAHLSVELSPVANQVNHLLARAEDVLLRERGFASAASHELRTPIAEARMLLEVALRKERTSSEWKATATSSLSVLARMQNLALALLQTARTTSPDGTEQEPDFVELLSAITAKIQHLGASGHCDPLLVRLQCPTHLVIACQPTRMNLIMGNLIRNAFAHGCVDEKNPLHIEASLHEEDHGVCITLSNQAPELQQQDVERLFDPLWRKNQSRNDQEHFGLGLAITRQLVESAGGSIVARLNTDGQLSMEMRFARADAV